MSTQDIKNGISRDFENLIKEQKRDLWREDWRERMEFRCTLINEKGLTIKCRKDCSKCSYFYNRKPNKVSIERLQDDYGIELESDYETPEQYVQRKEMETIVNNAIESLPSEDLKIVTRMIGDSASFQQIATALGISKPAAFKKWKKAQELLRVQLQDYYESLKK